jgi:hypothetical protein
LEDFINQEVTSLFIIELEDIGNFRRTQDYGFPLWIRKRKSITLEIQTSLIGSNNWKKSNQAAMKKGKDFSRHR